MSKGLPRVYAHYEDLEEYRAGMWKRIAGACLVRGVPEEFMRLGYWQLSVEERARADRDAAEVAAEWRDGRIR